MITLLGKIDLSKLSSKTRDVIQAFEQEVKEGVYVYYSSKRCVYIASGTLHVDLKRIKKRLEKERLNEMKGYSLDSTEDSETIGELYGTDEVLEKAKELIIKLSYEYIYRETTNILQYNLRL